MKVTDLLACRENRVRLTDVPRGVYLVGLIPTPSVSPWLVLWDPAGGPGCMCMDVEDGTVCAAGAADNYVIREITELSFK